MAKLLDDLVASEEADLRAAEQLAEAPALDRVASILDAAWAAEEKSGRSAPPAATRPASASATSTGVLRLVLAAAAVAAVIAVLFFFPREAPDDPTGSGPSGSLLGAGDLELVAPNESAVGWEAVEWNGPSGERFRVDIVDPADDRVLAGPHRTSETRWRPELPADLSGWPERVLIRLEILRPGEPNPERTERYASRPR
jgi:hypothetical protein